MRWANRKVFSQSTLGMLLVGILQQQINEEKHRKQSRSLIINFVKLPTFCAIQQSDVAIKGSLLNNQGKHHLKAPSNGWTGLCQTVCVRPGAYVEPNTRDATVHKDKNLDKPRECRQMGNPWAKTRGDRLRNLL